MCAPVGATIIGDGISIPNRLVDMSIVLTSTRTRGLLILPNEVQVLLLNEVSGDW